MTQIGITPRQRRGRSGVVVSSLLTDEGSALLVVTPVVEGRSIIGLAGLDIHVAVPVGAAVHIVPVSAGAPVSSR